jgi:hypothetical protein
MRSIRVPFIKSGDSWVMVYSGDISISERAQYIYINETIFYSILKFIGVDNSDINDPRYLFEDKANHIIYCMIDEDLDFLLDNNLYLRSSKEIREGDLAMGIFQLRQLQYGRYSLRFKTERLEVVSMDRPSIFDSQQEIQSQGEALSNYSRQNYRNKMGLVNTGHPGRPKKDPSELKHNQPRRGKPIIHSEINQDGSIRRGRPRLPRDEEGHIIRPDITPNDALEQEPIFVKNQKKPRVDKSASNMKGPYRLVKGPGRGRPRKVYLTPEEIKAQSQQK